MLMDTSRWQIEYTSTNSTLVTNRTYAIRITAAFSSIHPSNQSHTKSRNQYQSWCLIPPTHLQNLQNIHNVQIVYLLSHSTLSSWWWQAQPHASVFKSNPQPPTQRQQHLEGWGGWWFLMITIIIITIINVTSNNNNNNDNPSSPKPPTQTFLSFDDETKNENWSSLSSTIIKDTSTSTVCYSCVYSTLLSQYSFPVLLKY